MRSRCKSPVRQSIPRRRPARPAQVGFDPEGGFYEGASARFGDDFGPALFRFNATLARSDTFRIPTHDTEEFELVLGVGPRLVAG